MKYSSLRTALPGDAALRRYTQPTAGRLTLAKTVLLYMLGGALGTLWEVIFNLVKLHRYVECGGSLFTPFNPVYGCGTLVIVFCLKRLRRPWQVFLAGGLAGGALEYFLSYCEETILGTRSWNYSTWLWNLNGRTTVPIMIVWGILCMVVVFCIFRPLDKLFESLPPRTFRAVGILCLLFVCADLFVTVSALFRYVARAEGTPPLTAYGTWLDRTFPDAWMRKKFPSMRIQ